MELIKKNIVEIYRYYLSGLLLNSFGFLFYLILVFFGVDENISFIITYILFNQIIYASLSFYVFDHHSVYIWIKYLLISLSGIFLNGFLFSLCTGVFGFSGSLSFWLVTIIMSCLLLVIHKYFTFSHKK